MFIAKKKLRKLICEAYDKGVANGYYLGYQLGMVESRNREMILPKVLRDAEDILRKTQ